MKITYTKPINTIAFNDIPLGGCFIDHDGEICMKIHQNGGDYGAICFADNRVYSGDVFRNVNVRLVEVELIVHAEER